MKEIIEQENLKNYAHILDGLVVNVSVWDGLTNWTSEEQLIELPKNSNAGIGWSWDGKEFIDNRPATQQLI